MTIAGCVLALGAWSPCTMDCGTHALAPTCVCHTFRSQTCPTAMEKRACHSGSHTGCFDAAHSVARARTLDGDALPDGACPSPPSVHYATHLATGYGEGARALYRCAAGFRLSGRAESTCTCTAAAAAATTTTATQQRRCAWTAPPACVLETESPIGTPRRYYDDARAKRSVTCACDPAVHVATDVRCRFEEHRCGGGRAVHSECDGTRVHESLRVVHVKGAREHRHHKCALVHSSSSGGGGGGGVGVCRCCDCTATTLAPNGCPCGSWGVFFQRSWRMGSTKYWWTFRAKPGTTTCEVLGEVRREGAARGVADGDVYADGRLAVGNGRLAFEGAWVQPSDPRCAPLPPQALAGGGAAMAAAAFASLHGWRARGTECGFLHFFVADDRLDGAWRYTSWPRQESWGVDWRPPLQSTACSPAPEDGVPTCSTLHANTLSATTSVDFTCDGAARSADSWQQPLPWDDSGQAAQAQQL